MSHRKDTDYLSTSTRIRAMENRLLTQERMGRMLEAKDEDEVAKILEECGYGELRGLAPTQLEGALAKARADLFLDLSGCVPEPALIQVFQLKYDYHNIKALMKAGAQGIDAADLLIVGGRYNPQKLAQDMQRQELREVSRVFQRAAAQAQECLAQTKDPQLADFILDRAYFQELRELAKESGSTFLQTYASLVTDGTNLRIAVRAMRLQKGGEFLEDTLFPGGSVSVEQIVVARTPEALGALFQSGALAEAAALVSTVAGTNSGPLTEFERLCDNAVTAYLGGARRVAFGPEVVIGYLYAKEQEITAIRTIVSGRRAGLAAEVIGTRLRSAYV